MPQPLFPGLIDWLVETGRTRGTAHVYSSRVRSLWKATQIGMTDEEIATAMREKLRTMEKEGKRIDGYFSAWKAFCAWAHAEKGIHLWSLDVEKQALPPTVVRIAAYLLRLPHLKSLTPIRLTQKEAYRILSTASWDDVAERPGEDVWTWKTPIASIDLTLDEVAALRHWSPVGLLFPRGAQEHAPLTRRQFNTCRQAVEAMRVERTGL